MHFEQWRLNRCRLRKSGQGMLRTAYHVAAAAVFRPRQSWRRAGPRTSCQSRCSGKSPASPEAHLVEVRVSTGKSAAYHWPPGKELAVGPFTTEGTKSKTVPRVCVWDLPSGSPAVRIINSKPWGQFHLKP